MKTNKIVYRSTQNYFVHRWWVPHGNEDTSPAKWWIYRDVFCFDSKPIILRVNGSQFRFLDTSQQKDFVRISTTCGRTLMSHGVNSLGFSGVIIIQLHYFDKNTMQILENYFNCLTFTHSRHILLWSVLIDRSSTTSPCMLIKKWLPVDPSYHQQLLIRSDYGRLKETAFSSLMGFSTVSLCRRMNLRSFVTSLG